MGKSKESVEEWLTDTDQRSKQSRDEQTHERTVSSQTSAQFIGRHHPPPSPQPNRQHWCFDRGQEQNGAAHQRAGTQEEATAEACGPAPAGGHPQASSRLLTQHRPDQSTRRDERRSLAQLPPHGSTLCLQRTLLINTDGILRRRVRRRGGAGSERRPPTGALLRSLRRSFNDLL